MKLKINSKTNQMGCSKIEQSTISWAKHMGIVHFDLSKKNVTPSLQQKNLT
jgi:hypothetical protein